MSPVKTTRAKVLAYRVAVQGLHRDEDTPVSKLAVLDIGVQEAMGHPAGLAFAARTDADPHPEVGPGHRLALTWSLRGAPNVHRRADLADVAAALWPLSEKDALGRLNETGPSAAKAGLTGLEQYDKAIEAMRAVVTEPIAKGAASTAATKRLPPAMRRACRACATSHISDSAMRVASLAAGLELEPGTSPPVLMRTPKAKLPTKPSAVAVGRMVHRYLTLLGPATVADVAGYLDTRTADLEQVWPDGLVEVDVDGRTGWLPEEHADALRRPRTPSPVRLLGAFDPYLQARDRSLLVPDKALYKQLWPVLGRPGVLLVDGEVAGTWRTKSSKAGPTKARLTITVHAFGRVTVKAWDAVESEAQRVAQVRGAADVRVVRD